MEGVLFLKKQSQAMVQDSLHVRLIAHDIWHPHFYTHFNFISSYIRG